MPDLDPILSRMDRIIQLLEFLVIKDQTQPQHPGVPIPSAPPELPILKPVTVCSKCSMEFSGIMGYVCQEPGCPMGCGPMTC